MPGDALADILGRLPQNVPPTPFDLSGLFSSPDDTLAVEGTEEEDQHVLEDLARPPPPPSMEEG